MIMIVIIHLQCGSEIVQRSWYEADGKALLLFLLLAVIPRGLGTALYLNLIPFSLDIPTVKKYTRWRSLSCHLLQL
jgi:hypothetical protein